jgi:[ribosomal protein S18]-alanine N-acetyltransferase
MKRSQRRIGLTSSFRGGRDSNVIENSGLPITAEAYGTGARHGSCSPVVSCHILMQRVRRINMTETAIRPADFSDLHAIEAIENEVFGADRLSRRSLRNFIASPRVALLVAESKGGISGYALLAYRKGSQVARLYSIAIEPGTARRGIGTALVQACIRDALKRGCQKLRLEVRIDNSAAIRFYERLGFEVFGHYADYYEDGAAALRLEVNLDRV